MKNRIINKGGADKPETLADAALAFMKKIEPYVLGVKVSVIINNDHGFAFQYAESNIVNDALLGMELRPVDETVEEAKERLKKGSEQA
jgi:hypothetical protein